MMTTLFIAALFMTSPLHEAEALIRHSDRELGVSYYIPRSWSRTYHHLGSRTTHIMTDNRNRVITVTVRHATGRLAEQWNRWKEWYTAGMGTDSYVVIDQGSLSHLNPSMKLMVVQYKADKKDYLERIGVTISADKMVTVTCRAELEQFHQSSPVCDAVMGSIVIDK